MDVVEVFRSPRRHACDERALVLHAMGIASEVAWYDNCWLIRVSTADFNAALAQLQRYERENRPRRPRFGRSTDAHPRAWAASVAFALVLLGVAYLAGRKAFGFDWMAAGVADAAAIRAGDWWRAVTALTLHFDVGHLLANLGFGAVFVLFAGQLLGPGVAVLGILLAASGANLLCILLEPTSHVSAGASTAVFATLGLLSAYAWRTRADDGERWSYRWAPLLAGTCLLAFMGISDEHTDVLAHLTGFGTGALAGVWLAAQAHRLGRAMQWFGAVASAALVAVAWAVALASSVGH